MFVEEKKMISRPAFCLLLLSFQTLAALNVSKVFLSTVHEPSSPSSHFLKDVLKAISDGQSWNLEEIRVTDLDVRNARVGSAPRYEFRLPRGNNDLLFRFADEVRMWRKLGKRGEFESMVNEVSSKTVLDTFKIEGPFELRVHGNDGLAVVLPLNTTHTGLKRLLVGEGITIEVKGAQEVSLFHTSHLGLQLNGSVEIKKGRSQFWPFMQSLCMPLLPIHILGSATLVAYRTRNPNSYIETAFPSQETIELLPEKCYGRYLYKKQACPIDFLSSRLALLEKFMSLLGDRILRNGVSGFLKAKVTASTLVRFQLELERDVRDDDSFWGSLAEWRTKPTVERVRFEVVARVGAEKLKPIVVKKMRPFIGTDSAAWSNLMSNISFTKFPSVLVPSEALTLDVKW